jgi:hypothetical protein
MRSKEQRKSMSGAHLHLAWDSQNQRDGFSINIAPPAGAALVRQVGAARKPARCPECDSIVYSRRHRLCGVCNQPLPEHLLFSVREAARIEQLLQTERLRHRQWMEQRKLHELGD